MQKPNRKLLNLIKMHEPFSRREGFQPEEIDVVVRQDAPDELRYAVVEMAYSIDFGPKPLRRIVCRVLMKRPDPNNWSEYPNVDGEIRDLIDYCEWYKVYDIIEEIYRVALYSPRDEERAEKFEEQINSYFKTKGIGWQLVNGTVVHRGSEAFEDTVHRAYNLIEEEKLKTASSEIHEALKDLSRKPSPDITGAIQHSMAALECVAREVSGDRRATLGKILQTCEGLIPKPLDQSIEKAWGFASEMGRHLQEGREPSLEEAELVVGLCASISAYLLKKSPNLTD